MRKTIAPGAVGGTVPIPASKSHTIRALIIATLAEGTSRIHGPLQSEDTAACLRACTALGAAVEDLSDANGTSWAVTGVGGAPEAPADVIDVGNSGTTLYLLAGAAALGAGYTVFTGDEQIRKRTAANLLASLQDLGASAFSTRANGCAPFVVGGGLKGGSTEIECPTSQYLSSLLLCTPLASGETRIIVPLLHERPYAEMTLAWLEASGIAFENRNLERIVVPGGQSFRPFDRAIPADFSSATFFLCAPAVTGGSLSLSGLDLRDTQGDKAVIAMLEALGCTVHAAADRVTVTGGDLRGCDLDLNATPDALPALAVTACFAAGTTRLLNVPQARLKETDRIAVTARELTRLGADVRELPDGLEIRGRPPGGSVPPLTGGTVDGHSDHRIVMAFAVGALGASGPVTIETAEAADVTFPGFFELLDSARTGT